MKHNIHSLYSLNSLKQFVTVLSRAALTILLYFGAATLLLAESLPPTTLTCTNRHGPVELVLEITPATVRLDRDCWLTIRLITPENTTVKLPDINARLTGFAVAGSFARPAVVAAGTKTQEHCYRLTPLINDEYRLGPLAIAYMLKPDSATATATSEIWMLTSPLLLTSPTPSTPTQLSDIREPRRTMPSARVVAGWLALIFLTMLGISAVWWLIRRLCHAWQLKRMSPRQRALYELEQLLAARLYEKGQQKKFYAALAMIVRRYIERAYAIRAPEQTTEEFLATVATDARFPRLVLTKLAAFLQAADLVKFAAWRPTPEIARQAIDTARDYIQTES